MSVDIQATPEGADEGLSIDQNGLRVEARTYANGLSRGLRVSGIAGDGMSIGTTWGGPFHSNEMRLGADGKLTYIYKTQLKVDLPTPLGVINFMGEVGFKIKATLTPNRPTLPATPQVIPRSWWEKSWAFVATEAAAASIALIDVGEAAAIGAMVGIETVIAPFMIDPDLYRGQHDTTT